MGDSFTAAPSAIAKLGCEYAEQAEQLAKSAAGFGGSAFEISDAFGLLGACDGALQKYLTMLRCTMGGLEQVAQIWDATGGLLVEEADCYQNTDEQHARHLGEIANSLPAAGGSH